MLTYFIIRLIFNYFRYILPLGESNVVWKHGESVVFAGDIKIRKDLRIKLVDGTSLYIKEATLDYAGRFILYMGRALKYVYHKYISIR